MFLGPRPSAVLSLRPRPAPTSRRESVVQHRFVGPHSESALVAAAARGQPQARDRLVESFMPLIVSTARPYRNSPAVDRDELIQEGVVGLLRALERFEP